MILITGGAGYIGSHTILNLIEKTDYKIIIFDNLENGHIETVNALLEINSDRIIFEKGDLRNIEDIENVFNKYSIDGVIHFAAFALVEESVQNPSKYYRNNIYGTLNLLDTMIKHNVKRIVFSSTCATYGDIVEQTPIDEKHPQNPINPYGYSKLAVERIMDDYDKAYKLKSIRLRYFNVAGADEKGRIGEWHEPETHLIPNILKSNDNNKVFTIFGDDYDTRDGTCIRDYVNVLDLAEAHRLSYEYLIKENKTDVFNIGTGEGYSVKEVFEACERVLNKKIPVEIKGRRAGDPAVLYADIGKVKNVLDWTLVRNMKVKQRMNLENLDQILINYPKNLKLR